MSHSKLKFVSADCGAGKTRQLINIVNRSDEKFIIVQNTLQLIEQTKKDIPDSTSITSSNTKMVNEAVAEFLINPTHRVLLITDKSFLNISDIKLMKGYKIYVDDVVSFHNFNSINTQMKYEIECLIFTDFKEEAEGYVTASKVKTFTDDLVKAMADVFKIVDRYDHFIMNSNFFDKVKSVGKGYNYDNKMNQLTILAWVDLSKYVGLDITFMSNRFEETLVYLSNPSLFEEVKFDVMSRVKSVNDRLKVYYFSKTNRMSKTYRSNNADSVQKVMDYINNNVSDNYFYTMNSDMKKQFSLNGDFITPDTRGINTYQDYNTCVWLASLKPAPVESKVCEIMFDIEKHQLINAREYETIYQFVNRSALRNYADTSEVVVYVFDIEQAQSLSTNIEYIDVGIDGEGQSNMNLPLNLDKKKEMRLYRVTLDKYPTIESFDKWMNKKSNQDLTPREREHFYKKYNEMKGV